MSNKLIPLSVSFVLLLHLPVFALAQQSSGTRVDDNARATSASATATKTQSEGPIGGATESANKFRRIIGTLPALNRGQDGILNLFGQRATQNQLVTSTNVKDPVTDSFAFTFNVPVEAAEPVVIPVDQFSVTLAKFYATVPVANSISKSEWHGSFGSPFFSLRHQDGINGVRSAAPNMNFTGPISRRASLYEAFSYRLSRATIPNIEDELHDSEYHSFDWNSHLDVQASRSHNVAGRFALFSQGAKSATLTALTLPEASPDFAMGGGHVSFSDSFTSAAGIVLDTSLSFRKVHVRLLPQGTGPMVFIEQGELEGNYFDTLRRSSSRFDWKESVSLPAVKAWGEHRIQFGGGMSRSAFDSFHLGGELILRGDDEEELTAIVSFAGSPFEALAMNERNLWIEDRWTPYRTLSFTLGQRYDRTDVSRMNEWAPRFGFALAPFKGGRTVIRGGAGLFFDIIPLTVGTFNNSRQRVVQLFDDSVPLTEVRTLENQTARPALKTPHVFGWNLELNHQLTDTLFVRVRGEARHGRNLLLIDPNRPGSAVTALVLSNDGTSRYHEFEASGSFRPRSSANLNVSYIRSSSYGDINTFANSLGTFERMFISPNRFARSRSDAPHRVVAWGTFKLLGGLDAKPAFELRTGFPFAFVDASSSVPPIPDFSRFPRFASLDLGLSRDFHVTAFDRRTKVTIGLNVFNLTNHFNPRDAITGETEEEDAPIVKGFSNGADRTYRAALTISF